MSFIVKNLAIVLGVGISVGILVAALIFLIVVLLEKAAASSASASSGLVVESEDNNDTKNDNQNGQVFVYNVGDFYNFKTKDEARDACMNLGSDLATIEQLNDAYRSGAEWCAYGQVVNSLPSYPMQAEHAQFCDGKSGIVQDPSLQKAGATCYGVKPAEGTEGVFPFSSSKWSQ